MNILSKDLVIRKIKPEDADEMSRIEAVITKSPDRTDFRQIIVKQVRKDEDASFVAEIDGKVAGYMISYTVYAGFGVEKSAWIATLGWIPSLWGRVLGRCWPRRSFGFTRNEASEISSPLSAGIQWTFCRFLRPWVLIGVILLILERDLDS